MKIRYFIDTEFIEDGHTIDLVSIGIVAEDGRELYLQSCEFNIDKASQWVRDNVLPHLEICPYITQPPGPTYSLGTLYGAQAQHKQGQCLDQLYGLRHRCPWRTREQLKRDILSFTGQNAYMGKNEIELWGYYSAYDHVAFCQLFGTMMDLPKGFPMYTRDIKQWCDALGNPELPEQGKGEHHALADARWNKTAWEFLQRYEEEESHQWTQAQLDDLKRRWNALTEGKNIPLVVITPAAALSHLRKMGLISESQRLREGEGRFIG